MNDSAGEQGGEHAGPEQLIERASQGVAVDDAQVGVVAGLEGADGSPAQQMGRLPCPHRQRVLAFLYLIATETRKIRANPAGPINSWKPIMNTLTIHYGDPIEAANCP